MMNNELRPNFQVIQTDCPFDSGTLIERGRVKVRMVATTISSEDYRSVALQLWFANAKS